MVDSIWVSKESGVFSPVEKNILSDGDFIRFPDGRIFCFLSCCKPTRIQLVDPRNIPENIKVINMIEQSIDQRLCYGPSNRSLKAGFRLICNGRLMGRVDGCYGLGKGDYIRFPDGKMELVDCFGFDGDSFGPITNTVEPDDVPMGATIVDMYYLDEY